MSDRTQTLRDLSLHSCNNGISFCFSWNSGMWVWTSVGVDSSWYFCLLGALDGNDLLQILHLPIKAFIKTILKCSNNMSLPNFVIVYNWHFYEIKRHSQVKLTLPFMIESISSCFLIHCICTTHAVVVKLVFDPLYLYHPCHCCKAWWC